MSRYKVISKEEARDFLVNYHNLNDTQAFNGIEGILQCFEQIKSVQYDPLNVVGRNADLVLQAKVQGYTPDMLYELLYQSHQLIDGFDKEMCIYLAKEFQYFTRVRRAGGEQIKEMLTYRGQSDALNVLDTVREHMKNHGVTGAKDISIGESKESRWGHKKISSAALDYLYSIGELCVAEKRGVQKGYDFTKNVLPEKILEQKEFKNENDFLDWYIKRRIQSVGFLWNRRGGAWQGHYLSDANIREEVLSRLCKQGKLMMFHIEGIAWPFYMANEDQKFFNTAWGEMHVKFLAPLDNILWDRDMVSKIFDFEYRWEVYTPIAKRKYGYYVLPVLYGNKLIARFEPEKRREDVAFTLKKWWWEPDVKITDELLEQIQLSIQRFAAYLSVPFYNSYLDIIMGK